MDQSTLELRKRVAEDHFLRWAVEFNCRKRRAFAFGCVYGTLAAILTIIILT